MSKSKLITGIILLVTGGILIPSGFFVNQMFVDQIAEGVPDALLAVEEEALPSLEEQLPPLATPDVLLGVEDGALTSLEEQLPILGTPDVLLGVEKEALTSLEEQFTALATPDVLYGLKEGAIAGLPAIINGSGAAQAINGTIDYVAFVLGGDYPAAKEAFFNNITFQADYSVMQGVSDYWNSLIATGNLSYTVTAQNNLLYGVGPLPGLITDLELGMGLLGYMELCLNVSLGDQTLNATMQYYYNATWSQLEFLAGYIKNYLWDVVVKSTYSPPYTIEQVAEFMFYEQWANGTIVEGGIDLHLFEDKLPEGTFGLEAGVPNPTNITVLTCMDLWDVSNSSAFVNDTGILKWVGAMENDTLRVDLMFTFGLTQLQLPILLTWLGNFMKNLVPQFFEINMMISIPAVAQLAFYEQWANGTIQGVAMLPGGFLNELSADFADAPYFEVGLPNPSNLSLAKTMSLWDEANNYTFVNMNGILIWVGAMQGDTILQGNLSVEFSFTGNELPILLGWLASFFTVRVPQLIEYETTYTVEELAQLAFYEQWANGTIQGQSILPDGFLNELSASFAGAPYFEVGLPSPSNLSLAKTMSLWNETNAYAFVNMDGILVWLEAITNTSLQSALITTFGISSGELTVLLTWLGNFFTTRVPQLIEYETGYTVPELAQLAFYEQWANGTIQGLSILPDGFLSELDPPLLGPPYFEVGLTEGKTRLTASQCAALWDETSEYSLVNASGINKWYSVKKWYEEPTSTTYDDLKTYNGGLSNAQMTQILDWLPQFRDEIVNPLAKEELSLPMEPYAIGTAFVIGLAAGGGTLAVIGIVLLILSKRK